MNIIEVFNVHEALPAAVSYLCDSHVEENSRNGPVLVAPGPVVTIYRKPVQRVLFHQWRDANPYFHMYESLWMLAGRRDVAPLERYVGRMVSFSDDNETLNAAYGHRWRSQFENDQLDEIVARLRFSPNTRRCVLQIWNANTDLWTNRVRIKINEAVPEDHIVIGSRGIERIDRVPYHGNDAACNLTTTFQIRDGALDMVVFCRSNDIIWGCYGANAVHFSMLLEYVATRVGVSVGRYTQISVNWHAYRSVWDKMLRRRARHDRQLTSAKSEERLWTAARSENPYEGSWSRPHPIMSIESSAWDDECRRFVTCDGRAPLGQFSDPFFSDVALPMVKSHDHFREGNFEQAYAEARRVQSFDWRIACIEWLNRRKRK